MEGMRDLLRGSLGKSLGALTPLDKLAAAWPVACGRNLAERGTVIRYDAGRVTIRIADPAWLEEMKALRSRLTAELGRIASVELREIHFEVSEGSRSGSAAGKPAFRPTRPGKLPRSKK